MVSSYRQSLYREPLRLRAGITSSPHRIRTHVGRPYPTFFAPTRSCVGPKSSRGLGFTLVPRVFAGVTLRAQWRRFRRSVACSVTRVSAKYYATTSDPLLSLTGPPAFSRVFRSVFSGGAAGTERRIFARPGGFDARDLATSFGWGLAT